MKLNTLAEKGAFTFFFKLCAEFIIVIVVIQNIY